MWKIEQTVLYVYELKYTFKLTYCRRMSSKYYEKFYIMLYYTWNWICEYLMLIFTMKVEVVYRINWKYLVYVKMLNSLELTAGFFISCWTFWVRPVTSGGSMLPRLAVKPMGMVPVPSSEAELERLREKSRPKTKM